MSRRHDVRRVRTAHAYTVIEIADLFRVTRATVRRWIAKEGLEIIPELWPFKVHGSVLRPFLQKKNKPRQPTGPGELFCAPCKRPQRPYGGWVTLVPRGATTADLVGRCARCRRRNFQRVATARLAEKLGDLRLVNEDVIEALAGTPATPHMQPSKELESCTR
jgi:hypothetical protein